ncbi:PREDICTED: uncharacterized protein LOC109581740 isoform X1 [Amphimedon queenslandica]|uniref:ZU5 domain-containing protein n=1 Tax=Amphimedon queenslandica TaxID=400682 RepID=A0AAN0J3P8_AMPQE|nr:PREDICTED: uncharacterized protein LOC109581740 isoform X1 [Amphimedon queenslandica]|eukprot:XP_019851660.1 PREDICTED: uncharacterized protein LOC109581740 isoform X1 [Amphimedon queenslandica]
MDSLDSSVIIAGQKLFILQGDRPHSLQWEKYGFRLECPQGAVSKDTEVAVTALAGGNFKVPKGTVLVSAVYAISVSKALLKPLIIELQHCVDLRNTSQTGCLKFVRAPLKSPYQFSIVEGGSFRVGERYGSIKREQFCCMGIVAEMSNGDTPSDSESEEGYETPPEGSTDDTHNDSSNGARETSERTASPINTGLSQESVTDDSNQKVQEVMSTSSFVLLGASNVSNESTEDEVKQKPNEDKGVTLLYTGMMYHEEKKVNQWMTTFSVVRDLEVLQQYLRNEHPKAEKDGPIVSFKYNQPDGILQLCLQDTPSLESGWTVHPDQSPMQIHQYVVDKFIDNPMCSSIHISVYAETGVAKKPLHCPIELTGIDPSKIVYINKSPPAPPLSMNPISSIVVHESTSVSSTEGASPSAPADVNKVKKVIDDVLVSHYADLNSLKTSLSDLASQLYAAHLISDEVRETCSMEKFITEFKASLNFKRKLPQVQEHCQKFLDSFIAVRGSYADAAIALGEDWIEAVSELGLDFNININT